MIGVERVLSSSRTKAMKKRMDSGVAGRNMLGDRSGDLQGSTATGSDSGGI